MSIRKRRVKLKVFLISIVVGILILIPILAYCFNMIYARRLIAAINEKNIVELEKILNEPGNVNSTGYIFLNVLSENENPTPLSNACQKGDLEIIKLLVNNGADVNGRSTFSPLYQAFNPFKDNSYQIANYLINEGADVHFGHYNTKILGLVLRSNKHGDNTEKEQESYDFALKLIEKYNVDYTNCHSYGHLIMVAAANNNVLMVKYLVENKNTDINLQNSSNYTPLIFASREGSKDVVDYLLANGADVLLKNKDGKTALDMAKGNGEDEIIAILEKYHK